MARNVALAVLAACELGVSVQEISERLPQYRPSALRGKRLQGRGRTYFVDCYNANPASMADALSFFHRLAGAKPRLYVIGGMEELGNDSERFHRELGQSLPLRSGDRVVLVGESARPVQDGIGNLERVDFFNCVEEGRPLVDEFEGAVFLKGSREHRLEMLVPTAGEDHSNEPQC